MTLKSRKTPANTVSRTPPPINTQQVSAPTKINAKHRHNQIAKEAYYLAENSNFKGNSLDHWLQAEANIDAKLVVK